MLKTKRRAALLLVLNTLASSSKVLREQEKKCVAGVLPEVLPGTTCCNEVLHDRIITFEAPSYQRRPGSLYNQSNHGKAYFSNPSNPPQCPLEGLLQDNAGRRDRHLYCSDFGKGSGPASRCAVSADGSSCDCCNIVNDSPPRGLYEWSSVCPLDYSI